MTDNPYMMENTSEEEQRVKEVAARRHTEEIYEIYGPLLSEETIAQGRLYE